MQTLHFWILPALQPVHSVYFRACVQYKCVYVSLSAHKWAFSAVWQMFLLFGALTAPRTLWTSVWDTCLLWEPQRRSCWTPGKMGQKQAARGAVEACWWGWSWGNVLSLRSAGLRGDVSVVVHDTSAELCGGPSPGDLRVKLSRLEAPQAAEELKELLFTMADSLSEPAGPPSLFTSFLSHFCL